MTAARNKRRTHEEARIIARLFGFHTAFVYNAKYNVAVGSYEEAFA